MEKDLDWGYCTACRKEARRETGSETHWWHVGIKNALNCLWAMIASAEHKPEFILGVEAIRSLPRQKRKRETVSTRV